ncbi:hypothetical protein ACFWP2_29180 [Kitasatospora sp. NPDC058444]|uniref:hypothetical protein n=1 Tax=Kitasatospora sp. NPDC058444 TaxID=3346504 RepID=UPI00366A30C0
MTTPTAIPAAQPRKPRTRTTNVSCRPALLLSKLPLGLVDLTPRAEHLACPDCNTWCPLTTHKGTKDWKLVPHHTLPAGTPGARRCIGSNRLFVVDVPIAVWQVRRAEAVADVAARRPTTVLKKVKAPQPVALHQLAPAPATAETAHAAYIGHRSRCADCTDPKKRCADGQRLGSTYLQLLREEPERRAAQARTEQEQRHVERARVRQFPARRAGEWKAVDQAVGEADKARRAPLVGARSPIQGAAVPVGARPIGQRASTDEVLAASPLRKNHRQVADEPETLSA